MRGMPSGGRADRTHGVTQMGYVLNRPALLEAGGAGRRMLLDIAEGALAAADPGRAARAQLALAGEVLTVGGRRYDLSGGARIFVVGAGKASFPIAAAIDDIIGPRIHRGIVVCKEGQTGTLRHIEMRLASHPIPDQASADGAAAIVALLQAVRPGDIVLACFTGGSSALFVEPAAGITLADKAEANRILLSCGADIIEINAVRKHLSRVKGGRLARALPAGARLVNLTVSDVIGDRIDCITDPTVPDLSTFDDARATLDRYGLWERLPASVTAHVRGGGEEAETVREAGLSHLDRHDVLLLRADAACLAAAEEARNRGLTPLLLSTLLEGESRECGRFMAAIARQVAMGGGLAAAPCLLIGGGETTVRIAPGQQPGEGGPNQEFAAALALEIAGDTRIAAIGLDTDGTDGPTRYAGALVDGETVAAAAAAGCDLRACLDAHDVSAALVAAGGAILTGATGTNVNDLKLVLVTQPS